MIYFPNETALLQSQAKNLDAAIAQLAATAAQRDQAVTAASARAQAAHADASRLTAEVAALQAQAAAADQREASLAAQLADLIANEPESVIRDDFGKPTRTSPAWLKWNKQMTAVREQHNQAVADAATAHAAVNQRNTVAAQSQAAAAAADQAVADATAQATQLRQQAAQVRTQKDSVAQQIAALTRWQQELDRQPLDRTASEAVERELSARIDSLENEYALDLDLLAAAQQRQAFLQATAQDLSAKIAGLTPQIQPAQAEVAAAASGLASINAQLLRVLGRQ
jgi:chromosome segregation ATPase